MTAAFEIRVGDCSTLLRALPDESVQCVVTSPPYLWLRTYGVSGQIGLEPTVEAYVERMVEVFDQVRRVLRADGTLWLNLGDKYAQSGRGGIGDRSTLTGSRRSQDQSRMGYLKSLRRPAGFKSKDLLGIPWRVAFALQDAGWYLRRDIIWHKPTAMPESCWDRPTTAHEYLFLLTKRPKYYYDSKAIAEPVSGGAHPRGQGVNPKARREVPVGNWETRPGVSHHARGRDLRARDAARAFNRRRKTRVDVDQAPMPVPGPKQNESFSSAVSQTVETRNRRSVWTIASSPFKGAHFATYPPALVEPCILAGSRRGDTVLDPFAGAGTTGLVASRLGRAFLGIEINPEYAELARRRIADDIAEDCPLFQEVGRG